MSNVLLSCDWGTSSFRLRLIDASSPEVIRECRTDCGVDRLGNGSRDRRFRDYLAGQVTALVEGLEVTPGEVSVWVSGMASSSIGWKELPYAEVPFPLDGAAARVEDLGPLSKERPHPVRLVSGLRTSRDVLRGEETQALGLLASPAMERYRDDAVLLLPGTHSKHIEVREGRIVDFSTFLTGELFEVLGRHSILRHSVKAGVSLSATSQFFRAGVRVGKSESLLKALFTARTNELLRGIAAAENTAYLSGLLIGSELGGLSRGTTKILLAAPASLAGPYRSALDELGLLDRTNAIEPEELTLAVARGHVILERHFGK